MAVSLQTDEPSKASFFDLVSCKICLDILKKPVQCQRNEHYFCTVCITKHLKISQSCPLCVEKLTTETLRPIPRVVADLLSQIATPSCKYVQRGCKETITHQDLPIHHQVCGFAPVLCSNKGCRETVNKQDKASHERESCQFRKIQCEVCDKIMMHCDYGKHTCVLRQEVDEMKVSFVEMKVSYVEMKSCLKKMQEELTELRGDRKPIKNLPGPVVVEATSRSSQDEEHHRKTEYGQILVAGGNGTKSYEVFNWSTKSWTLFEDALFFQHSYSFSFPYNNNIMICGGTDSNRIECLNVVKPTDSFVFPSCLPSSQSGKGVRCGDQIITFGDSVSKTSLKPPYSSNVISAYDEGKVKRYYGVESINESVVMVGGEIQEWITTAIDVVTLYNSVTNELKQLAPLPYKVSHMATVPYKDNIIILGGHESEYTSSLYDSVIMYNVTNQQCKKLPSMLEKRLGCTAVIMGEMIVVMGGSTAARYGKTLNTVEYLVLGEDTWKELPSMHCAREGATASVQV